MPDSRCPASGGGTTRMPCVGSSRSRRPMDGAMQRRRAPLTTLLKAQVQRGQRAACIRDAVDCEPAQERVAATPLAEPVESTFGGVVKGIPAEIGVVTRLELAQRAHGLEISEPPLNAD